MSRQINQPINQVKLTNVAVVRCNRSGKRFEIACYRNKVMDYLAGLETDLSEVLQTERIFTNVSKGQFAKVADLEKAFGTRNQQEIAKIILEESDKQQSNLQVSDLERAQSIKDTLSQIATWVVANCVHSDDGNDDRPFTVSQIKHALGKNYTVHPHKPIKKQCLDAVKFLKTVIPIERAKMEVQLQYPPSHEETIQSALGTHPHKLLRQTTSDTVNTVVMRVDPSLYRDFSELMTLVDGSLEIMEQVVMSQQGDMDLELQLELNSRQQQLQAVPEAAKGHVYPKNGGDRLGHDEHDSDVEELVEKLQNIRGNKEDGDEHHHPRQNDEDDSDDDDNDALLTRKQHQKKNKKKSKKQKRREQEEEEERHHRLEQEKQRQATRQQEQGETPVVVAQQQLQSQPFGDGAVEDVKSCNTCGGAFANAGEYRAHFRSDWHRFNQKLKLKGVAPVTQEEFLLCDADSFFTST